MNTNINKYHGKWNSINLIKDTADFTLVELEDLKDINLVKGIDERVYALIVKFNDQKEKERVFIGHLSITKPKKFYPMYEIKK